MSSALPAYSFDNIGSASAASTLDSSLSAAAVNSGRYIQDDLPVLMPDGTSLPLSSLTADGSVFAFPGIADGKALADLGGHGPAQPATAAQIMDSVIGQQLSSSYPGGSDSLNLGASDGEVMTSEELTQYIQSNTVLTELASDEFRRQFDGIVFQQVNDSAAAPRPPQFSEH